MIDTIIVREVNRASIVSQSMNLSADEPVLACCHTHFVDTSFLPAVYVDRGNSRHQPKM